MNKAVDRLSTTFDRPPTDVHNLSELADKVVVNYELLQEENKLLLQERELYFD